MKLTIGDSSRAGKLHVGAPFDEQALRVLKRPARLGISSVRGEDRGCVRFLCIRLRGQVRDDRLNLGGHVHDG
jgi:hypothetical protein